MPGNVEEFDQAILVPEKVGRFPLTSALLERGADQFKLDPISNTLLITTLAALAEHLGSFCSICSSPVLAFNLVSDKWGW